MEPTVTPPEPEARSEDISLSDDNIVNAEKAEEEEHSDSGSAITGVDLIFVAGDDDIYVEADGVVERTKLELPEEYAKSVMALTCDSKAECGSCHVYLIGTAHVSEVISSFFFFLNRSLRQKHLIRSLFQSFRFFFVRLCVVL